MMMMMMMVYWQIQIEFGSTELKFEFVGVIRELN